MVNSNVNALGVIFANTYDNLVPELVAERSMASIPFGGRYRLIDFTLSSMVNAGIFNGDYVVVEQQPTAENGQKVVALVDDSATVKTFYKEDGYIRLQPENDAMEPIIVEPDQTFQILGRVIGVFRFMH